MKYIFIATTALNRPDLHKTVFHKWYKLLNKLNYNIIHFINIDCIDKLSYTYEDTSKNFKDMTSIYNIGLHILPKKTPDFFLSCLTISKQIDTYIEFEKIEKNDVCVFWLEDDWILNRDICLKEHIKHLNTNSKLSFESHINYTIIRKNYIWALMPSILGYNVFKEMLNIWTKNFINDDIKDPESCIGLEYIKKKYQNNSTCMLIIDNTLDKLHLNDGLLKVFSKYRDRFILDINNTTNCENKIYNMNKFKDKFNIIVLANSSMDVGRNYMENLNIKKKKQKNKQFVYIKINN